MSVHRVYKKRKDGKVRKKKTQKYKIDRATALREYPNNIGKYNDSLSPEEKIERDRKLSREREQWWKGLHPLERRDYLERKGEAVRKAIMSAPKEFRQKWGERVQKGMRKILDDPVLGPKMRKKMGDQMRKNIHGKRRIVRKKVKRINDYAGVITESEMEELNGKS